MRTGAPARAAGRLGQLLSAKSPLTRRSHVPQTSTSSAGQEVESARDNLPASGVTFLFLRPGHPPSESRRRLPPGTPGRDPTREHEPPARLLLPACPHHLKAKHRGLSLWRLSPGAGEATAAQPPAPVPIGR